MLLPYDNLTQETMTKGLEQERQRFEEISNDEVKNGDIVAFFKDKLLYHVGIYYNGKILQTTQRHGVTLQVLSKFSCNIRYYRYAN